MLTCSLPLQPLPDSPPLNTPFYYYIYFSPVTPGALRAEEDPKVNAGPRRLPGRAVRTHGVFLS